MAQNVPIISDLGISSIIESPPITVHVTRPPFFDDFTLVYYKEGRKISEELDPEETRKWFKAHMKPAASFEQEKQRDEKLGKLLDEAWNFYETKVDIPADLYTEPVQRFPQYQPKI